jgi:hypothetical protein
MTTSRQQIKDLAAEHAESLQRLAAGPSVEDDIRSAGHRSESSVLQDDLAELLRALGMSDAAQPRSPHHVMQDAIAEIRRRSAVWASVPVEDSLRAFQTPPTFDVPNRQPMPGCHCATCEPQDFERMRMITCALCGNKRCPHATDHRNDCTRSNEPGQPGSAY